MRNLFISAGIFVVTLLAHGASASESKLDFLVRNYGTAVSPGSEFLVDVNLVPAVPVNALELEIGYTPETMKFVGFTDSDSAISFWMPRPNIPENGVLVLGGGAKEALSGREGNNIVTLRFRALHEGAGEIFLFGGRLYAADGTGETVPLYSKSRDIVFNNKAPMVRVELTKDTTPPELSLTVVTNPVDRERFVFLDASDEETGVREVSVRAKEWISWSEFASVNSIFRVPRGVWAFQIRSVNNAGVGTERSMILWRALSQKVGLLLIPLLGAAFFFLRKRSRI